MTTGNISSQYQLDWDIAQQGQNTSANTSQVYGRLIVRKLSGSGYWSSSANAWSVNIDGQAFSGSYTYDFRKYSELMLWQGTVTVTHNADGTRSVNSSGYASMSSPSGSLTLGRALTLTTIPRASKATFSASPVTGTAVTINTNRASSSFTHDITWSFGNLSGTVATGVTTSTSWTPAHSLFNQSMLTSATVGTGGITVVTKNGGTVIGTTSTGFTLSLNSNQIPTLTNATFSEAVTSPVNIASVIGAYVQGQSKLSYTINGASGIQGSSISSYAFSVGSVQKSGASGTTGFIQDSGTVAVTATVTDSRGRESTPWTTNITVLAWSPPQITTFTAVRSLSTGVVDPNGTYIKVTVAATVSNLTVSGSQKNTLTYLTDTSPADAESWTNKRNTAAGAVTSVNTNYVISSYAEASSWDVRMLVRDRFATTDDRGQASIIRTVSVASVTLDLGEFSVGIGKFWNSGALDVGGDLVLNAMNGMTGKIDMPNGRILPVYSTTGLGSAGVSYFCVARLTAQSETANFEFYGGENRTAAATATYSARVQFKVRTSNAATVEVWEFGAPGTSTPIWYIKQNGEFDAELWVMLPAYRSSFKVSPEAVGRYAQYTSLYPYGDETATDPGGLVSTGVNVHPDLRQTDFAPFQPGANGFSFVSGWSNYTSTVWNGLWISREGNMVTINGAITKSSAVSSSDAALNIPAGWRPYRAMQGEACQLFAPGSNSTAPTQLFVAAQLVSLGITYQAVA